MAWEYFHPDKEVPLFLKYIEDRDLWNWKLPFSAEFNVSFMTETMSFKDYEEVYAGGQELVNKIIDSGKHIMKFANQTYRSVCSKAVFRTLKATGHRVIVVNTPSFKSEVGNILSEYKTADFAMVWNYEHTRREFWVSLRAHAGSTIDVAEVAKNFGGGGHAKR